MNNKKKTAPETAISETERNKNITTDSITGTAGKIKVVLQKPGEISRIVEVPNTLRAIQELVGGYIEVHPICNDLLIVMDEEGRFKGLPENVCCVQYGKIVGAVFVTAVAGEEFRSLTAEEIQAARGWLLKHSV